MGKGGSSDAYYYMMMQQQQQQAAVAAAAAEAESTKVYTPAVRKELSSATVSAQSQLAQGSRRFGIDSTYNRQTGVTTDNKGHRTLGGS